MLDVKGSVGRLELAVAELKVMVARIDAQIPYLATKADLADKPGKAYMWGILCLRTGGAFGAEVGLRPPPASVPSPLPSMWTSPPNPRGGHAPGPSCR